MCKLMKQHSTSSFARQYAKLMAKCGLFPAWQPMVNSYQVGDYGTVDKNGTFHRISNIYKDFEIKYDTKDSVAPPLDLSLSPWVCHDMTPAVDDEEEEGDFTNKAEGDNNNEQNKKQKHEMKIDFLGKDCMLLRTQGPLTVTSLDNLTAVALQVFQEPEWRRNEYFIVQQVYSADQPVILGSTEPHLSVTVMGTADALQQLQAGAGSDDVTVSGASASFFHQMSASSGPVALNLFQVKGSGSWRPCCRNPKPMIQFATPKKGSTKPEHYPAQEDHHSERKGAGALMERAAAVMRHSL